MLSPPVAFLSHASEDKAGFVEPLARKLAELGVKPWLDKWEIRPATSWSSACSTKVWTRPMPWWLSSRPIR